MSTDELNSMTTESREVNQISEEQMQKLKRWNIYAAVLHLITGIVLFGITDRDATAVSVTLFQNVEERGNPALYFPIPRKSYNVILGYFSGVFLLLAAADHFICATFGRRLYEYYLRRSQNHFRWAEYALSASFMHIMIAYLSGITDIHTIYAIYGLTFTTMVFGSEQERNNWRYQGTPEKKSLLPFWYGCIPHIFGWTIICCHFFYAVSKGDPPGFVWAIIFILLILDSTFAINMYLQQKEIGKWRDYYYGELGFMVLSFTAKQLLAWLNYGGTRSLNN